MTMFELLEENEPEEKKPTDYTGVIIGAILTPVYFVIAHFNNSDMALSAFICLAMIMLAIRIRWDLRKHFWFWTVIVLVLALHVPLVLMVHWPDQWVPGIALLPIGLADFLIVLGIIKFVEKFIVRAAPADEDD